MIHIDAVWRATAPIDMCAGTETALVRVLVVFGAAHARRKFYDLRANHKSRLAGEARKPYGELYDVERNLQEVDADGHHRIRQL